MFSLFLLLFLSALDVFELFEVLLLRVRLLVGMTRPPTTAASNNKTRIVFIIKKSKKYQQSNLKYQN
jgi:hypothetical protein